MFLRFQGYRLRQISYEELLDDPAIEVLDIAVPPKYQLELIQAACSRGTVKGILAQKPLALSYAEAVQAVRCCERVRERLSLAIVDIEAGFFDIAA